MLFTITVTLKFSQQFHAIRNTIFHMKHIKFLLNKILYKYAKFLTSKTCNINILHAKDFKKDFFVKFHKRCEIFMKSDTVLYSFVYREIIFWGFVKICRQLFIQIHTRHMSYSTTIFKHTIHTHREGVKTKQKIIFVDMSCGHKVFIF